jgi:FkbM family methyltransferase
MILKKARGNKINRAVIKIIGTIMRNIPKGIRRIRFIWEKFYTLIGGGRYTEDEEIDQQWMHHTSYITKMKDSGYLVELNLNNWVERRAFFTGNYYQSGITQAINQYAGSGTTYIDIGANIGFTVLLAAKSVGKNGRVVAFEPNPIARARLESNLSRNRLDFVKVEPFAISNCNQTTSLFQENDHTGKSSLIMPENKIKYCHEIMTRKGDDILDELDVRNCSFIKIDVEGHEYSVLQGIKEFLKREKPIVIAELSPNWIGLTGITIGQIFELMRTIGYTPFIIKEKHSRWKQSWIEEKISADMIKGQTDVLFKPQ